MQGCGWAVGDALPAEGAIGFADGAVVTDVDGDAGTGAGNIPDVQTLDFVAHLDAAHAFDALGSITDEGRGFVPVKRCDVFWKWIGKDVEFIGYALEFAVAVAHAGWAVAVVLRQNQLQIGAAGSAHTWAVGVDDHAFADGIDAGRDEMVGAFHFDNAHAAGADFVKPFPVTQAWYGMASYFGSFEDGHALWHVERNAVNCDVYHLVCLPPLKMP